MLKALKQRLPCIPYDRIPGLTPHRLRRCIIFIFGLGFCGTGVAGGLWWQEASRPEYALKQAIQGIREHDETRFGQYVRRSELADQLAAQVENAHSTGPALQRETAMSNAMAELQKMTTAPKTDEENPAPKGAAGQVPAAAPGVQPLPGPVPVDMAQQLANSAPHIITTDGDIAIAAVTLAHPALGVTYPVKLALKKDGWRWQIAAIANMPELIRIHDEAIASIKARNAAAVAVNEAAAAGRIAEHAILTGAAASLDTLSQLHEVILILRAEGEHVGRHPIQRMGLTFRILDARGELLRTVNYLLELNGRPGKHFANSWTIPLDMHQAEDYRILHAKGPLQCKAFIHMLEIQGGETVRIASR